MSLSFKQFHQLQSAADLSDEEFASLEEGLFGKSDDERAKEYNQLLASKDPKVRMTAERGLKLLADKKNNLAQQALARWQKIKADREKVATSKERHAQAVNQADDEGSSKARRDEQGSIKRAPKGSGGTQGTYGTLGTHDFNAKGGFNWNDDRYRKS